MAKINMFIFRRQVGNLFLAITILAGVFVVINADAKQIENTDSSCADLIVLFARGSSSNPDDEYINFPFTKEFAKQEEVPGAFFQWMEKHIKADLPHINYKAISIHNSGHGWSVNGYPAVGVFDFNPLSGNFQNMMNAAFSWWPAGDYRNSVDSGAHELAGQVNFETSNCPNQRIVVGGYSQGAHVVHEALKIIPEEQRSVIDNVVLFGDPKYIAAKFNKFDLLDTPVSYPWARGTAGLRETGLAGPEFPYVPEDMKYKTISWCHEDDFVCTNFSGVSWAIKKHALPGNDYSLWKDPKAAMGDGHMRYPNFGVPEAAEEVFNNIRNELAPIEIARGGLDSDADPSKKIYDGSQVNDRHIDIMFAFNRTSGNDDALFQYLNKLPNILVEDKNIFPNLNTGSIMYTDMAGGSGYGKSYIAAYSQVPNQLTGNIANTFKWSPYLYGPPGGGGDYPENHGMAIERAGTFAGWRKEAVRHVVVFAERPASESYTFDACSTSVLSAFPIPGVSHCNNGATFSTYNQSFLCENILDVLASDTCKYAGPDTNSRYVSRSLVDAVTLARARGFVVDIVQPHKARDGIQAFPPASVEAQLKNLAESTGGLYLKYDTFGEPQMRDAMWRILNHIPSLMNLKQYLPGTNLNPLVAPTELIPNLQIVNLEITPNQQLLTSPISGARSYSWDLDGDGVIDQTSEGPAVQISSPVTESGFMRVYAMEGDQGGGNVLSELVMPYVPTSSNSEETYLPTTIDSINDISASRAEGSTNLEFVWGADVFSENDLLLFRDPVSGIILASVPATEGAFEIDLGSDFGNTIIVQAVAGGGESEPLEVTIDTLTTAVVGENNFKEVLKEPNSFFELPSSNTSAQAPFAYDSPVQTASESTNSPQAILAVAGAQDTKTNPQSAVGGVDEVQKLFPEENISPPVQEKGSGKTWWIYLALSLAATTSIVSGIYIFKNKKNPHVS